MLCFEFRLLCKAFKTSTTTNHDSGTTGRTLLDFHVDMDTFYTSSLTSLNYVPPLQFTSVSHPRLCSLQIQRFPGGQRTFPLPSPHLLSPLSRQLGATSVLEPISAVLGWKVGQHSSLSQGHLETIHRPRSHKQTVQS